MFNMLVGIYVGQCVLYLINKYHIESEVSLWGIIILMIVTAPIDQMLFDYGTLGTAFVVVGRLHAVNKEDPGFLLLLAPLTMMICLQFDFNLQNNIIAAILIAATCYALNTKRYSDPISVDIRCISRHSLAIYFVHVVILSVLGYVLFLKHSA